MKEEDYLWILRFILAIGAIADGIWSQGNVSPWCVTGLIFTFVFQ